MANSHSDVVIKVAAHTGPFVIDLPSQLDIIVYL